LPHHTVRVANRRLWALLRLLRLLRLAGGQAAIAGGQGDESRQDRVVRRRGVRHDLLGVVDQASLAVGLQAAESAAPQRGFPLGAAAFFREERLPEGSQLRRRESPGGEPRLLSPPRQGEHRRALLRLQLQQGGRRQAVQRGGGLLRPAQPAKGAGGEEAQLIAPPGGAVPRQPVLGGAAESQSGVRLAGRQLPARLHLLVLRQAAQIAGLLVFRHRAVEDLADAGQPPAAQADLRQVFEREGGLARPVAAQKETVRVEECALGTREIAGQSAPEPEIVPQAGGAVAGKQPAAEAERP